MKEAETVVPNPITEADTGTGVGTVNPQIQAVYPGTLQTVPAPPAPMAGITRDAASQTKVILAFTRQIDIASLTLNTEVELYQGAIETGFASMTPGASSRTYILTTNALAASTTYTVRIYKTLYEAGVPTNLLDFSNLGTLQIPPGDTYVEYSFTTSAAAAGSDTTPPVLSSTDPATGATNVPINLDTGTLDGYISVVFDKTINPATVTNANLQLETFAGVDFASGWQIYLDTTDTTLRTYRLYPNAELDYNTQYRLNISPGGTIQDINGNAMLNDTTANFTTVNFAASTITDYIVEQGATPDSIKVTWYTSTPSITYIAIDDAPTFVAAVATYSPAYPTEYNYYHSHEFNGLTRNQIYSVRLIADANPAEQNDQILNLNGVYRTTPTAAQNSQLAVAASTKSSLRWTQIDQNRSYVVFRDSGASTVRAQYINTGAVQWGANGSAVSASDGTIEALNNGSDGVIVTRSDGTRYLYAANIHDAAGLSSVWGAPTEKTIFDNGAASTISSVRAAFTYSGYVSQVTSGNSSAFYVYDTAAPFAPAAVNYNVLNDTDFIDFATITAKVDNSFIELNGRIITSGNLNYRVFDNTSYASGQITMAVTPPVLWQSNTSHAIGNVIRNITTPTTNFGVGIMINQTPGPSPYWHTNDRDILLTLNSDTYETYTTVVTGTAETNALYTGAVIAGAVNDIVVNRTSGISEKIADVTYAANGLLILTTVTSAFPFPTNATPFNILRLPLDTNFVAGGTVTATAANDIDHTAGGITAANIGDIIYNVNTQQYAEITGWTDANTITISSPIFAVSQSFIIVNAKTLTFAWDQAGSVYGKTVDNADGSLLYPNALTTSRFTITSNANTYRNAYIVSDLTGNAIVVYEIDNGGGTWGIRAKKVQGNGSFLWGAPADTAVADGITIVSGVTPPTGSMLITKVVSDGAGGAWILSQATSSVSLWHITTAGAAALITAIANAYHPDMERIGANTIGIAYERNTTVGSEIFRRIYAQTYDSTPAQTGVETHVRPGGQQPFNQVNPRIGPDGSGGCIVSWMETKYLPSIYYAFFAQHFNATLATNNYGDDRFVAVPVRSSQSLSPYLVEHGVLRFNDAAAPNAGMFIWADERSAGQVDIYFEQVAD